MTPTGTLEEGVRGGVVWLIPETSEDVEWFDQKATVILDQAFPEEAPLPIVIKTTSRPYPRLLPTFLTLQALSELTEQERKEVTVELFEYEKRQQELILRSEMHDLRGEPNYFTNTTHKLANYKIPAAYRPLVSLSSNPTIKQVLEELYRHAYRFSPPEFFTHYRNPARGTNNLWRATRLLSTLLLRNNISGNIVSLRTDRIASDILQMFLQRKWKIVRDDYAIQEPEEGSTALAWRVLEEAFKPGVKNAYVRQTLIELMNPPYGYDYNTLTLLFTAWIGYHQHDLQFSSMGRQISIEGLSKILTESTGSRTTFIGEICGSQKLSIARRDSSELVREVKELIERVNKKTFDQESAEDVIAKLEAHYQDAGLPENLCIAAKSAADRLATGLEQAREYDRLAKVILSDLEHGGEIKSLIQLKKRISDLPRTGLVEAEQKSISELDTLWREALQNKVNEECDRLTNVKRLQDVGQYQSLLEDLKKLLKNEHLDSLVERVQEALAEIGRRNKELEAERQELPIQAEIRAMDRRMPLKTLQGYLDRLKEIQGYSQATMDLRAQYLSELTGVVSQLMHLAEALCASADDIDSIEAANGWMDTCLRNYERFEGTATQAELDAARQKVEQTRDFFARLREIDLQPRNSLQAMEEVIRQLEALQVESWSRIGSKALQTLAQTVQKLKDESQQRCEEARRWLDAIESKFNRNEPLAGIIRELETPKQFLPPGERPRLEALKKRVQHRQAEDVIGRIELEFRKIKDPSLRQKCLRRLQAIVEQEDEISSIH